MVKLTNSVQFCITRDINYIGKVCLQGFTTLLFKVNLFSIIQWDTVFSYHEAKYGCFVDTMKETGRIQHVLREKNDNIFLLNNNFCEGLLFLFK